MMPTIKIIYQAILHYLSQNAKNGGELLFFITVAYYIITWLSADQSKKLTLYFYGYMLIGFMAHCIKLDTITHFLYLTFPATAALFIIMHQSILQRNIIALRKNNYHPEPTHNTHWIDTVLRSALMRMHQNHPLHILIERTDNMTDYLQITFPLHTTFSPSIAELLDTSNHIYPHQMIVCNKKGFIYGANAIWHHHLSHIITTEHHWAELDTYYTTNTDAIIVYSNPSNGNFNLILNGHLIENLPTHQIRTLLIQLTADNNQLSYDQLTNKDYYVAHKKKSPLSEKNS